MPVCAQSGVNDTIIVNARVINGVQMPWVSLDNVTKNATAMAPQRVADLRKLRYNVYKVYPYAIEASKVLRTVDLDLANKMNGRDRRQYIKAKEDELKDKFKAPLKDLTTTQGLILVKLVNRQTGKEVYEVIKELKGGLKARLSQTVAGVFDNDLKVHYDPYGTDADIEMIVRELENQAIIRKATGP